MDNQISEKLAKANELRESEQYGESAKLFNECLISLIPSDNHRDLVHCLAGYSLIYKILSRKENSSIYRNLTLTLGKEALGIAQNFSDVDNYTKSVALMSYADALFMDNKIQESLPLFEKALEISTAGVPENGRIKTHIGEAKYLLGEKENGINLLKEALQDIRTGDLNSYAVRVWETGALNTLVSVYMLEGNKEEAKKYADESLQIATSQNLSIRKREVETLISKI